MFVAILALSTLSGPNIRGRKPASEGEYPSSYEDLIKYIIKEKEFKSLDEFILDQYLVGEAAKTKIYSVTPVVRSSSPEFSSPEFPRLILLKSDKISSNLVLSVTTNPDDPDYDTLQIAEVNSKTFQPRFFEIEFDPKKKAIPRATQPTSCNSCHVNGLIWTTYPFWPHTLPVGDSPTKDEAIQIEALKNSQNSRLRLLLESSSLEGNSNFGSAVNFSNFVIDTKLKQLAKILKESPQFQDYKYLLAGALFSCPNIEKFLPAEEIAKRKKLSEYLSKTAAAIDTHYNLISKDGKIDTNSDNRKNADHLFISQIGRLSWVMKEFFLEDLSRFSVFKGKDTFGFWNGLSGLLRVGDLLKEEFTPPMGDFIYSQELHLESSQYMAGGWFRRLTESDIADPSSPPEIDPSKDSDYDMARVARFMLNKCSSLQEKSLKSFKKN